MNKYRIYLNNNDTVNCLEIYADAPVIIGTLTLFYLDKNVVASIPNHLVFIKL